TLNAFDINFTSTSTLDSGLGGVNRNSLIVTAAGAVSFGGDVGAAERLLNLTVTAKAAVTVLKAVLATGDVNLTADETTAPSANNVIVNGSINAANIGLEAGDAITVNGSIVATGSGIALKGQNSAVADSALGANGITGVKFGLTTGTLSATQIAVTGSQK